MKRNARYAFNRLKAMGAPVYDICDENEACQFILGAELRDENDTRWADSYHEDVREEVNEAGEIVNAFGIDERAHRVARAFELRFEWINPGQVGVYVD